MECPNCTEYFKYRNDLDVMLCGGEIVHVCKLCKHMCLVSGPAGSIVREFSEEDLNHLKSQPIYDEYLKMTNPTGVS